MIKVIANGNLTRDPIQRTAGTVSVVNFGIACKQGYGDKVTFIECSAFGKTGETIATYCQKGKPVVITGTLALDQWEKDGQKFSRHSILVNEIEFLGGKKQQQETYEQDQPEEGDIPF